MTWQSGSVIGWVDPQQQREGRVGEAQQLLPAGAQKTINPHLHHSSQVLRRRQRLAGHHRREGVEREQVAQRQRAQVQQAVLVVVGGVGQAVPELPARPRQGGQGRSRAAASRYPSYKVSTKSSYNASSPPTPHPTIGKRQGPAGQTSEPHVNCARWSSSTELSPSRSKVLSTKELTCSRVSAPGSLHKWIVPQVSCPAQANSSARP